MEESGYKTLISVDEKNFFARKRFVAQIILPEANQPIGKYLSERDLYFTFSQKIPKEGEKCQNQ